MFRRRAGLFVVLFVFLLGAVLPQRPILPLAAQTAVRYFPETHHTVRGLFLDYWTGHGGLAQQGYPLTEEFAEPSALDGTTYTVQYFERAVFEHHPENAGTPYEVLLAQLGSYELKTHYPAGPPPSSPSAANARAFPETGRSLGGTFRAYWDAHGGLAQQGYPLTDELTERNALDGKTYTVQYFERAVFEYHPENAGTPTRCSCHSLASTSLTGATLTRATPPLRPYPTPAALRPRRDEPRPRWCG